ncbi:MAG: hypothetical protein Ct9H90mP10_10590 [Actinomycetota bacterium]|nr:MAG: hypothetical protein Ct9H90mP10_10590 [Actinomycetota bacterium]
MKQSTCPIRKQNFVVEIENKQSLEVNQEVEIAEIDGKLSI